MTRCLLCSARKFIILSLVSVGKIMVETFKWQYVPVVLFTMLYKVVLPFESVDEILKCDHSNESY